MDYKARRIRELINLLNEYTKEYDKGNSKISDEEWDNLYFELEKLEKETGVLYPDSPTQSISYKVVNELQKKIHEYRPMLSLAKTKEVKDIERFCTKEWFAMFKMDGLSGRLTYSNGKLVGFETRGNGVEGEWILHNAKSISNIPKSIPNTKETVIVDGEIICKYPDFEDFKDDYRHIRNFAAGSIRLLDASECARRKLSFVAWDLIKGCEDIDFNFHRLEMLDEWGFETVPRVGDAETVFGAIEVLDRDPAHNIYPIDGYVFKFESKKFCESLGKTDHHFNDAIGFKFYDEEYETTLEYIDYDVSRNGILTPVAVFKSIEIDNTDVSRASLHNLSIMEEVLGTPYLGQKLWVCKQNQIIPQVVRADKILKEAPLTVSFVPTTCPICGTGLNVITSDSGVKNLLCPNENCSCRLINRIDHYCSKTHGLNIKGLSRKTIEKLLDWGLINGLTDIYKLEQYRTEWESKDGFGKASVGKIIDSINAEGRHPKLESFISALGIPLVGKVVSKIITKYYNTWDDFRAAVGGDWTEFEGIGPEISKAINNFDYSEADEIVKYLDFAATEVQDSASRSAALEGKIFCVTGKMKQFTRDSIKADIESKGGKMVSSISSKVDYLITNSPESGTSKNKEAIRLGIPIISEEEYINLG